MSVPSARFTLDFWIENGVAGLRWCRVKNAMFTNTDLGKERLVREGAELQALAPAHQRTQLRELRVRGPVGILELTREINDLNAHDEFQTSPGQWQILILPDIFYFTGTLR